TRLCAAPCVLFVLLRFSLVSLLPPALAVFPTRRSSDLRRGRAARGVRLAGAAARGLSVPAPGPPPPRRAGAGRRGGGGPGAGTEDRKSTRLNSSHVASSYAVFRLKKKNNHTP